MRVVWTCVVWVWRGLGELVGIVRAAWSRFPWRHPVENVFWLVVLTAVIPIIITLVVVGHERPTPSFYDVALWTFLCGVVIFHTFCFLWKEKASRQLPRLIDYLYVSSALIGLSGAAVDLDRTARLDTHYTDIRLSRQNLQWMRDETLSATKSACDADARSRPCVDLGTALTFMEAKLPGVVASDDMAVFTTFTRDLEEQVSRLAALPVINRDHISHYGATVRSLAGIDPRVPEPDRLWKFLAVVFLPSALALRITKISVEIFEWFPKKEEVKSPGASIK